MKRREALFGLTACAAAAAAVLNGCGGGGVSIASIGSGGTGITPGVGSGGTGVQVSGSGVGAVEGFGSIIVNGTRFDITDAQLLLADIPGLRLGVTVQVFGRIAPDTGEGVATVVRSAAELRGPAVNVNLAAGTFSVHSLAVAIDVDTVFAGGLMGLADLRNGDPVQVHGLPGDTGVLRATRVERLAVPGTPVLTGIVQSLDAINQILVLGTQRVRYAGAAFNGSWPASGLAPGMAVRVRAAAAGALMQADSVEPWYAGTVTMSEGSAMTLSGLVSNFTSAGSLRVDGIPVDASGARVSGEGGRLGNGARVDVTGVVQNGVLVATRLKVRSGASAATPAAAPEDSTFSARGSVGAYRSRASFKVQGQDIDASNAVFVNGTAAQLGSGTKVFVTGSRVADDVLLADRVEFL